eukprot:22777_1
MASLLHMHQCSCRETKSDSVSIHCDRCSLKFCGECSIGTNASKYLCKLCIDVIAYDALYSVIFESTKKYIKLHDDLIRCVMEYCMGFIVDCCNCCNIIRFQNRLQFENRFDCNGMRVYYYHVSPKHDEQYTVKHIDDQLYRIFCKDCVLSDDIQCCALFGNGCVNKDSQGTCCANCAYLGGIDQLDMQMDMQMFQQADLAEYSLTHTPKHNKTDKCYSIVVNVCLLFVPLIACVIASFVNHYF